MLDLLNMLFDFCPLGYYQSNIIKSKKQSHVVKYRINITLNQKLIFGQPVFQCGFQTKKSLMFQRITGFSCVWHLFCSKESIIGYLYAVELKQEKKLFCKCSGNFHINSTYIKSIHSYIHCGYCIVIIYDMEKVSGRTV